MAEMAMNDPEGSLKERFRRRWLLSNSLCAIRHRLPQTMRIGRYRIRLPIGSSLPETVLRYPLVNIAIGKLADTLKAKYPDLHVIDIGANGGDTAAIVRQSSDIPVLCIEGDENILPLLRENISRMGAGMSIEPSFVGEEGKGIDLHKVMRPGLNASMANAVTETVNGTQLHSLESILVRHPGFDRAKLLKIDAEGYDFDIVLHSVGFIESARPVIYFEYNPFEYNRGVNPEEITYGPKVIERLAGLGYAYFLYFDSFGHFLARLPAGDDNVFHLHEYLRSNWANGTAVPYFDVCAVPVEDSDLQFGV